MTELHPTLEALIRKLADGQWHSGEALGESLGVSRAAVSKQLKQLDQLALGVESIKGRGYRLSRPLDLFSRQDIQRYLSDSTLNSMCSLQLHSLIDSTNTQLMRRMRGGERIHAEVCLAEQQSAGRGRRGREWHSPFAQNLYLSVAWHFEQGVSAIEGLSLAVGVSVCRALESLGIECARLKWPNDLLVDGKKLGGVLVELGGDAVSDCVAIVGVGLNVNMETLEGSGVDQSWVSLSQLGYSVSRSALVAEIINELFALLSVYQQAGFVQYRGAWNDRNAFDGESVRLISASSVTEGVMLGVDASGALRLRLRDGEIKAYIGGELSLRKCE